MFNESDAGVYQCVLDDTVRTEVFFPTPIRVDTGKDSLYRVVHGLVTDWTLQILNCLANVVEWMHWEVRRLFTVVNNGEGQPAQLSGP